MTRAARLAALALGAFLLAQAAWRMGRMERPAADLVVDHLTARAFWRGGNPFSTQGARQAGLSELGATGLGHPPTTSFWILPLAWVDLATARAILGWLSLATLLVEMAVLASVLDWGLPTALLAAGLVASGPPFQYLVALGQISQLIGFAYFLAWWALRRGRQGLAGAALGAACTMKLFPGLMVLFLIITRRWRAAAVALATFLAVAGVMTARFGLASWPAFLSAQRDVANAWMANVSNSSIHGVTLRLLSSPACTLPGPVTAEALALSTLLSLGLVVMAARQSRAAGLALSYATFAVLSVLISQWAWEHYLVIFVTPVALGATALRERYRAGERSLPLAGALALAALVSSAAVDVRLKLALQNATFQGKPGAHLALHAAELINWLPSLLLLAVLLRTGQRAQAAAARRQNEVPAGNP